MDGTSHSEALERAEVHKTGKPSERSYFAFEIFIFLTLSCPRLRTCSVMFVMVYYKQYSQT